MKKLITIEDLDDWGACCRGYGGTYSDENLENILDGRLGLTVLEVLRDTRISAQDRMWVVLRKEVICAELYDAFGHICASRAGLCYSTGANARGVAARSGAYAARSAIAAKKGFMSDQVYQWVYTQAEEKERQWQVDELIRLIEEEEEGETGQ